jgi:5-methylcytosine-specific restriction endonuclease McrA
MFPVQEGLYKSGRHKGEPKWVNTYQCAVCENMFRDKDIEVDHKVQAGSLKAAEDLAGFVTRLFCHEDHLQVVCKPCHKIKTAEERKKK